jgi:hypothetical protein
MVYRTDGANPNMGYVDKGEPPSDKRPHGFGRVPAQASGLKPSDWKAECAERRPLRLEGGKTVKSYLSLPLSALGTPPRQGKSPTTDGVVEIF